MIVCSHPDSVRAAATDLRCPLCMEAEIERLWALVKILADDLADEIEGHYSGIKDHPAMKSRYERNMGNVYEARRALGERTKCEPGVANSVAGSGKFENS